MENQEGEPRRGYTYSPQEKERRDLERRKAQQEEEATREERERIAQQEEEWSKATGWSVNPDRGYRWVQIAANYRTARAARLERERLATETEPGNQGEHG